MPQPRPGSIQPLRLATNTLPLPVSAGFNIPPAKISSIEGVPAATRGSIFYPAVFSFGWLTVHAGWDVRGARRGKLEKYTKGLEDTTGRIS